MTAKITICLIFSLAAPLLAEPREWKNQDGSRSIRGEFLKRESTSISIRRSSDQKEINIPLDKLHADELVWIDANDPTKKPHVAISSKPSIPPVFDKLSFGETRDEVFEKLKSSEFVELAVAEALVGRTGLNDVFRTRKKIGGLDASLFFDWDDDGKLIEINLQTCGLPASALKEQLTPCWKDLAALLTSLYGKPIVADSQLRLASIRDGTMFPSHLWNLEKKGSATLGAAREGDDYKVIVRFSEKIVQPVTLP